ncbi:MAG: SUMF1/EgtB/PvdO family nonheme iron enzyme [Litorilituus sp.]|jgi:formylglycine-generating enzyme required for sulfatase activity|nr:SUMF1/EgtB/PvdO family nonheme iron enzyme [Litorilituus sp.]
MFEVNKIKLTITFFLGLFTLGAFLFSQSPQSKFEHIITFPENALVSYFDQDTGASKQGYVKVSHDDYVTKVVAIQSAETKQFVTLKPRLFFELSHDKTYNINGTSVLFKGIPSGEFIMGDDDSERANPARKILVNEFRIMQHEVTWALYELCVADGACTAQKRDNTIGNSHPVTGVSWQEITNVFIPWFNNKTNSKFRLPSEAEWEYVARSGQKTHYYWGNKVKLGLANCWGCGSPWDNISSAPVMSFPANSFGVYDMHGNVWEWTADCFANYNLTYRDSRANILHGCDRRVIRGGGFRFRPMFSFSSYRGRDFPHVRSNGDGFRLAQGNMQEDLRL